MKVFKFLIFCALLVFGNYCYSQKTSPKPIRNVASPKIAFHNDTEILHDFKELFLNYYNRVHKSEYYKHLANELYKKAQLYQKESIKLSSESKSLLNFIIQKIKQHKGLQKQIKAQGKKSILFNAKNQNIDNRILENFVRKIAAKT